MKIGGKSNILETRAESFVPIPNHKGEDVMAVGLKLKMFSLLVVRASIWKILLPEFHNPFHV